jgi:ATP-binding cassette, subfamily B, bacterial
MHEGPRAVPSIAATTPAFLLSVFSAYRWSYVAALILQTAASTCAVFLPWALSRVIRGITTSLEAPAAMPPLLVVPVALFIGLTIAETVFGRLRDAVQVRVRPRVRQFVTRRLYEYLQYHSHRYFSDAFGGSLAHRISEASLGVAQTTWSLITELWPAAIVLVISVVLLYRANDGLGAFFLLWSIAFVGIAFVLAARAEPWGRRAAAARSETSGMIVDALSNQQSVRLFAQERHEIELLRASQSRELELILAANLHTERVRWFQFGFAALLKGGTLWISIQLWSEGAIGVAELVLAVSLSFLIINEVSTLSRRFSDFFESLAGVSNGLAAIAQAHEIVDAQDISVGSITEGRIEFRAVDFAYREGTPVFAKLDLTVPAGQKLGLVGYSGAGKSTLVNLILRQYEPQSGCILIDGIDIRHIPQTSLRRQIGYIPQEPQLFHRTLRENIRYGRLDASDEEVERAAHKAGAHEFIMSLPGAYSALVGERGVKLSGGQRQRIALARVMLKGAPLVILDEATSSLDAVTEKVILDALDMDTMGKTVVVVAHRLSTISHLDRILVIDQGGIAEDGNHAELLSRKGLYWRLWSRQADGFLPVNPVPD